MQVKTVVVLILCSVAFCQLTITGETGPNGQNGFPGLPGGVGGPGSASVGIMGGGWNRLDRRTT